MMLNTLDDIVLRGYEKVTYWAHKAGKTKYDLVQVCDTGEALGFSGYGVYLSLAGTQTGNALITIAGGLCALSGLWNYSSSRKKNERQERRELQQLVNTGAAQAPYNPFRGIRPLGFALGTLFLSWGIDDLIYGVEPSGFALPTVTKEQYGTSLGLALMAISAVHYFRTSASYFRDTTMFPPQKDRKPLWKKVVDYVARPFRQKAPVPVPAE
ncbi:hypothetical protein HYS49_03860 [Candidatus Woesearchaeota archaeon]|nr:hypothetical protein [Candidatus Woesearchaeota archaeon]